ncbi:MAG: 1-acyl-sn-glycerol-3-phosphate acyltransferase [Hyphomicrobiaceae bacterium]|nr:1-acyl-sn-glycerol-3-phosphate acyltransferase [Hyphomicrobiaceae bacterium]
MGAWLVAELEGLGLPVVLPRWGLVVLAVLSSVAIVDRIVRPFAGWLVRWRAEQAFDRLNAELRLKLQSFKMTRRRVLIERLLADPEVLVAVEAYAGEKGVPLKVATRKARTYAREIVPAFSTYAYFRIGTRLARIISRSLYRVRLGVVDPMAMDGVPPNASVVFVINHRSNIDYVLVTYVAATASALSYAVGEWAQVFGLRELIRTMGAYFIRRNSGDQLYRRVLARYVDMATKAGVVQAVFPEGGLSRDGHLKPAKLGLITYMVSDFDPNGSRDIVFIPVGLNYDRVLEDRILLAAAMTPAGETPRFGFSLATFLRYQLRSLWLRLTGRWHRYGYACVSFGRPVSLKAFLAARAHDMRALPPERRRAEIEALGEHLMGEVGHVVPALPVPLAASALLAEGGRALTAFELKARIQRLIEDLEARGHYVHIPRGDRDYAVEAGLRVLRERRLVELVDGAYAPVKSELPVLQYYANSLAHLLAKADVPRVHSAQPAHVLPA